MKCKAFTQLQFLFMHFTGAGLARGETNKMHMPYIFNVASLSYILSYTHYVSLIKHKLHQYGALVSGAWEEMHASFNFTG